jgi:hypothetical protein
MASEETLVDATYSNLIRRKRDAACQLKQR